MKKIGPILMVLAIVIAMIVCISSKTSAPSSSGPKEVIIKRDCNMFDKAAMESDGWEGEMWPLKSGTTCTMLNKSIWEWAPVDGGSSLHYYKLRCGTHLGYVNINHIRK